MPALAAERALLHALNAYLRDDAVLVTYNGRTFDVPVMELRGEMQRVPQVACELPHLDMLHPARRLWRMSEEGDRSCRLTHLEESVLGFGRVGDVGGFEIPARYFHFVRGGSAALLEPAVPFRAKYEYSNLMFIAAGEVIRAVSGLSWEQFTAQRIFSPLGMNRSVTSTRELPAKGNVATPHKTYSDRSQPIEWMNWDVMGAAGGVISSVSDMSKWMQCQLAQGANPPGAKALFTQARSREMWEAHTPIPVSEGSRRRFPSTHFRAYGLGWSLSDYLGYKLVGHGGGYDGMYSQVLMAPEKGLGVVVLTNSMTGIGSAITYKVMDTFLGGAGRDWSSEMLPGAMASQQAFERRIRETITPVATGTHPSQEPSAYTGLFRCPMYGDARVELENGKLVLRLLPYPDLVADLAHLHYDTYEVRWRKDFAWFGGGTAQFIPDSKGRFVRIALDIPNDDLWFYELKLERVE